MRQKRNLSKKGKVTKRDQQNIDKKNERKNGRTERDVKRTYRVEFKISTM